MTWQPQARGPMLCANREIERGGASRPVRRGRTSGSSWLEGVLKAVTLGHDLTIADIRAHTLIEQINGPRVY